MRGMPHGPALNKIGVGRAPGEVKHLSTQRKRKRFSRLAFVRRRARGVPTTNETIPLVVASEKGTAQTSIVKLL